MPARTIFTETTPLPGEGELYEREVLDLKATAKDATPFHMAKDVAAFANLLGGTVLVGAQQEGGRVKAYVPMAEEQATATIEAFSAAVRDRCRPMPFVQPVRITRPGGFVVALNVDPELRTLVGVKVASHKLDEGYGGESFVFPVRTITDARYLTPEELPMFMQPSVRRATVLLSAIPKGAKIRVEAGSTYGAQGQGGQATNIEDLDVDEGKNVVHFKDAHGRVLAVYPIDQVASVYHDVRHSWVVLVRNWSL